jgi:hypothetical protein
MLPVVLNERQTCASNACRYVTRDETKLLRFGEHGLRTWNWKSVFLSELAHADVHEVKPDGF